MADRPRVVILGAGFAGVGVAQELARLLPSDDACDITLVDQNNFLLFTPMLPEVAGGAVDPSSIVAAIRSLAPRVVFEQGCVEKIDPAGKTVQLSIGGTLAGVPQAHRTLHADHLVVALGSVTNFHHIDGLAKHALGIKTVEEAESIRNRAIYLLERADEEDDSDARRALMTFVVGGGGFSGVETMAALNDLVRGLRERYPRVAPGDIRMVLVHAGSRLLPEVSEKLAGYTQQELEHHGVEVMLSTLVSSAGDGWVTVKPKSGDGTRIDTHTLIWAGGVKPNPAIEDAGLELGSHHGIVVDGCCRVPGHPGVWALGDCAEVPQPHGQGGDGKTYAPTAQNATREGAQVARNIMAVIRGEQPQPFVYHPIGELAVVGKRSAVASVYGMQISGVTAWLMWRAIYLAKLPHWPKRVRVGIDWLLDAVAGRDIADLPGAGTGDR